MLVQHTLQTAEAGEMSARALANVAYGATRGGGGESAGALFAASARVAERRDLVCEFKPQQLANTAWAFATAGQSDNFLRNS